MPETLETFKAKVRDKAIEVADEQGWCDAGLNDALMELGLDPKTSDYRVTVTYEIEIIVEEQDSEREAIDAAIQEVEGNLFFANDYNYQGDGNAEPY